MVKVSPINSSGCATHSTSSKRSLQAGFASAKDCGDYPTANSLSLEGEERRWLIAFGMRHALFFYIRDVVKAI